MKYSILFILFISFLAVRCTIERRVYNRGFHVEWNKKIHSNRETVTCENKNDTEQNQFTLYPYTQNDSVFEIHEESVLSHDSVDPQSEYIKITKKNTDKKLFLSTDNQNKTTAKNLRRDDTRQSNQLQDEKELARKKSTALFLTILGLLIIIATLLGFFWAIATIDTYMIIFTLLFLLCSGALGCILLFFSITLWDSYSDAKNPQTISEDASETLDEPKSKKSGWVFLGIVGLIIGALILNNFI